MKRTHLLLFLMLALALPAPITLGALLPSRRGPHPHTAATADATIFLATFDGTPAGPTPYLPDGWDVQRHNRDRSSWAAPEMMEAHHGATCAGYPATHHVMTWAALTSFVRVRTPRAKFPLV